MYACMYVCMQFMYVCAYVCQHYIYTHILCEYVCIYTLIYMKVYLYISSHAPFFWLSQYVGERTNDQGRLVDCLILSRLAAHRCPHRLVVRTSRRGRDNPGSTPGEDIYICRHVYAYTSIRIYVYTYIRVFVYKCMTAGLEPAIFGSQDQRLVH